MAIEAAEAPAARQEIGVFVISVTSEYFVGDKPVIVRDMVNAIWLEHLAPYPAWAIRRAVSWWLGPDNPKCGQRPQAGHIAARARQEAACLDAARENVRRWNKYRGAYPAFLTVNNARVQA